MVVLITSLIAITLLLVLLGWTWHSLGTVEKTTKIGCIIGGLVIVYIITFIIYNISKNGITYENEKIMKTIQNVFVPLFTIINSYIILPYIFKKIDKINNDELEISQLKRSILILIVIILVVGIFEVSYLGNIQQGILSAQNLSK